MRSPPDNFSVTTRVSERVCPACRAQLDAATGGCAPLAGDFSICVYCSAALVFTDDAGALRVATPADIAGAPERLRVQLRRYAAAATVGRAMYLPPDRRRR